MSSKPGEFDVLCGRGKQTYTHKGNCLFRRIVEAHVRNYTEAKTKLEKTKVVTNICNQVRRRGEFTRQSKDGLWIKVSDRMAREKVGQVLRDLLHCMYKSSSQAKQQKRKMELLRQEEESHDDDDDQKQPAQQEVLVERHHNQINNVAMSASESFHQSQSDRFVLNLFSNANTLMLNELKRQQLAKQTALTDDRRDRNRTTDDYEYRVSDHNTCTSEPRYSEEQIEPIAISHYASLLPDDVQQVIGEPDFPVARDDLDDFKPFTPV
mmetsp:Transcript_704/g.975  ORF Transcript_704/g.975 Transcript_704/m.975 type:complete len:266 (-) Transcript_704:48-845(-)